MDRSDRRLMIVVIGAYAGFLARLQDKLGDDFAVVAGDTQPIEEQVFELRILRDHEDINIKNIALVDDEPPVYAGKQSYALPNKDRQYLNKWQPR